MENNSLQVQNEQISKPKKNKSLEIIFSIFMLILFSSFLIIVWGGTRIIDVEVDTNTSLYETLSSNYYFNIGWNHLFSSFKNSANEADKIRGFSFVFGFVLYLTEIITIYILSIKGIIATIRNLSYKQENDVEKYALSIALIYMGYYVLDSIISSLIFHSYKTRFYLSASYSAYGNIFASDGLIFGAMILWMTMTVFVVRKAIYSKEGKDPKKLISKILIGISLILTNIIIANLIEEPFHDNDETFLSIIFKVREDFGWSNQYNGIALLCTIVIFITILSQLAAFLINSLRLSIKFKIKLLPLIISVVSTVLILVSIIAINVISSSIYEITDINSSFISSNMIASLICSIVSNVLVGVSVMLEKEH